MSRALLLAGLIAATSGAWADSVLIHNATVHTLGAAGKLEQADILISDGVVTAIGRGLEAPAQAQVIEANGQPVTPGLFGGLTHLGLEEIGIEPTALQLGKLARSRAIDRLLAASCRLPKTTRSRQSIS